MPTPNRWQPIWPPDAFNRTEPAAPKTQAEPDDAEDAAMRCFGLTVAWLDEHVFPSLAGRVERHRYLGLMHDHLHNRVLPYTETR